MTRFVAPLPRLSRRARLRLLWNPIETSWIGDAIGVASLFGSLWLGLVLADALWQGVRVERRDHALRHH